MPRWGAFIAVILLATVLLLVLARQSQQFIHDRAEPDPDVDAVDSTDADVSPHHSETLPHAESGTEAVTESATDPVSVSATEAITEWDTEAEPEPATGPVPESTPREDIDGPQTEGDDRSPDPSAQSPEIELSTSALLANVAITQAVVAAVVVVAAWYFGIPAEAFGLTSDALAAGWQGVAVGIGFGILLWVGNELSTAIADVVGATYDETVREMLAPETPGGWAVLLTVVLPLIALSEELLFRAALIGVPAAGFDISPWLLAVASSLAFALGHGAQGRVGVVVTGVLGFALAAGYILTGSLLVVVVAHYVINALEFVVHEFFGIRPLVIQGAR